MALLGDVKQTIKSLLPKLKPHLEDRHLQKALDVYDKTRKQLDDLASANDALVVHPQYIAAQISQWVNEDTVLTCDVETPTVWAARYLKMNGHRRLLGSFKHGSMANALPQAIDAQIHNQDRQVVVICGDGGFAMLMGDLLSVAQHQLPIKIVIFNNSSLGIVTMEIKSGGYLTDGTGLKNPYFAAIATACNITGIRVEKSSELPDSLQQAFACEGSVLIDVITASDQLAMPPQIKLAQA